MNISEASIEIIKEYVNIQIMFNFEIYVLKHVSMQLTTSNFGIECVYLAVVF